MLQALMDGRALTASELARVAGVTPQTASGHLTRLTTAGLLAVEQQGRHRYHRLASPAVAQMMESIMLVASRPEPTKRKLTIGPRDALLRAARTCYDHLAGRLGVALTDALVAAGQVELAQDGGLMTDAGMELLCRLGIDVGPMVARSSPRGRVLCRPCLDWSERRPHLAGAVGAALCSLSFANGWIRRIDGTRAVTVTPKGQLSYRDLFGIAAGELGCQGRAPAE
jgi:hypothetical protein